MRTFTDGRQIYEPPMGVCACGQRLETSGGHWRIRHYDEKGNVIYEVCMHGVTTVDDRPEIKPKKMEFNSEDYDIDITGGILKAFDELSDDIGVTHKTVEGIVVDEEGIVVDEQLIKPKIVDEVKIMVAGKPIPKDKVDLAEHVKEIKKNIEDEQLKEQNNDKVPMHFVLGKEDE